MSFPHFDRLSPITYFHTRSPTPSPTSLPTSRPATIILATWANAPPKLINLYAASYRKHFLGSRIILITSSMEQIFLTSSKTHDSWLAPIIPILKAANGPIVAATYSNGGSLVLTSLARLYASTNGSPLPIRSLVLDSTPGSGTDLASGMRAILATLPPALRRPPTRYLVVLLFRTLIGIYWLYLRILGKMDPITRLRRDLLDEQLIARGGERTYIYSREDEMVDAGAVEKHANDAEAKGWSVKRELWEGSGHVAHARADGERYWKAVKGTFES